MGLKRWHRIRLIHGRRMGPHSTLLCLSPLRRASIGRCNLVQTITHEVLSSLGGYPIHRLRAREQALSSSRRPSIISACILIPTIGGCLLHPPDTPSQGANPPQFTRSLPYSSPPKLITTKTSTKRLLYYSKEPDLTYTSEINVDHEDILRRPVKTSPEWFSTPGIRHLTNDPWVSKGQVPRRGRIQVRRAIYLDFSQGHSDRRSEEVKIDSLASVARYIRSQDP